MSLKDAPPIYRRPMPVFAVDVQGPARLLGEAVDHAQPESAPSPDILVGEERLNGAFDDLRRHAATGVAHRKHDVVAWRYLGVSCRVVGVKGRIGGLDRKSTRLNSSH